MKSIGLRALKDHLSETIEEVERGEVIEITKRGRTVARVVPVNREVSIEARRAIVQDPNSLAGRLLMGEWRLEVDGEVSSARSTIRGRCVGKILRLPLAGGGHVVGSG
ncbi:MAG TPA: type II toxin-antitoxin system prevent-host-death family antitoxin [Chloroflexia bacterium]|nr:type II toxin-antitoxin system prevent-host-death family antitoxin [Chloroflexia bacterium]